MEEIGTTIYNNDEKTDALERLLGPWVVNDRAQI